ncbi:hypothetical protein BEN78_13410 [Xanthomonas citri pv. mangiferaeindicae]|uniref:nitrous oxide reductase accessory protein NosL n=1 Tax=Luteimonas sp. gir TaxID=3127960 RepID=UPI000B8D9F54|nr:hypothetical protein BEN78_13410 [Xanthomonas citri pv. mangiferaeindicae]
MTLRSYWTPALLALGLTLAACAPATVGGASDPTADASCELDGMLLADYPGPKGQIRYADGGVAWFCDTIELLSLYLAPEQVRAVAGAYTQDMGAADWDAPKGHWIALDSAWFVAGADLTGSMGPTLASFAQREAAEVFARAHGGRVLAFAEITPDLVRLDGGMHLDHGM